MRNFVCTSCGTTIYFENSRCSACGSDVGFEPGTLSMVVLVAGSRPGLFGTSVENASVEVAYCANARHGACNWLADTAAGNGLCLACDLNRTIPNLSEFGSLDAWRDMERAKKRLVYSLLRFGLSLGEAQDGEGRLAFDFVRDATTGHKDGVITIDILEADAVERERQRQQFGEPYRTLLGHLRHESGHYYWMTLIENAGRLDAFRAHFGDERLDYAAALARHHAEGPWHDWQKSFVSSYASVHPWEDWAETWAHYLQIVDAVDTADAEGVEPISKRPKQRALVQDQSTDVYRDESFTALIGRWMPLSTALNSLSRCMGHDDFYPFVVPAPAYKKLAFVHDAIRGSN